MSDNPNLPATDLPLTAGFWEASKRHVLTAQKCLDCGYLRYPALEICPRCWSADQANRPTTHWRQLPQVSPVGCLDVPHVQTTC